MPHWFRLPSSAALPKTLLYRQLDELGACKEGLQFVGTMLPVQAWNLCNEADWFKWIFNAVLSAEDYEKAVYRAHGLYLLDSQQGLAEETPVNWISNIEKWRAIGDWFRDNTKVPSKTEGFWDTENRHVVENGIELMIEAIHDKQAGREYLWPDFAPDMHVYYFKHSIQFDVVLNSLSDKTNTSNQAVRAELTE